MKTTVMPTIDVGRYRTVSSQIVRNAARLFVDQGSVLIRGAFSTSHVRRLHRAFVDSYHAYFRDREFPDALQVGRRRTMITVDLRGPFNSARLYANPAILPVLETLLGHDLVLGSLGAIVSLPGAADQHVHRDYPHILEALERDGRDRPVLPPYAVTLFVPLLGIDTTIGTIRLWPRSQTRPLSTTRDLPGVDPIAAPGDCLLMDYRLLHHGTANRSDTVRPVLYLIYQRPWFRDALNYEKQQPLRMSEKEYSRVSPRLRRLFDWLRRERGCFGMPRRRARPVRPPRPERVSSRP
jgi:Phytanoyl-CoA dioxygenase (PhyH)